MSVAHVLVVPAASVTRTELAQWDAAHDLLDDQAEIIRMAIDTLRRHMRDQLIETDAYQPGVVGKPAKVFRRR